MEQKIINNSIHNWVNNNKELLSAFRGRWIAHNEKEVLASAKTGRELASILKESNFENYILAYIHPTWFARPARFLPLHFKSLKTHEWTPNYFQKKRTNFSTIAKYKTCLTKKLKIKLTTNQKVLSFGEDLGEALYEYINYRRSRIYWLALNKTFCQKISKLQYL